MNYISDILYWISTGLLVPVIVLLIILFGRSLLLIGSFFGQYMSIRKTESLLRGEFDSLTPGGIASLGERIPNVRTSLVTVYIHRMLEVRNSRPHVERLLADFEIAADKDLAISKTLTKMGPMLGLIIDGIQYAGGFCYNSCRIVCQCYRVHYTASQATLVSSRYD